MSLFGLISAEDDFLFLIKSAIVKELGYDDSDFTFSNVMKIYKFVDEKLSLLTKEDLSIIDQYKNKEGLMTDLVEELIKLYIEKNALPTLKSKLQEIAEKLLK